MKTIRKLKITWWSIWCVYWEIRRQKLEEKLKVAKSMRELYFDWLLEEKGIK